jgi:hypothetical protein
VVHTCNPSNQEVEAERLRVQGQPGLYVETLPQSPWAVYKYSLDGKFYVIYSPHTKKIGKNSKDSGFIVPSFTLHLIVF